MPIQPSAEVTEALRSGRPLVALESTLICHGIPRPRNLALAQAVEAAVREAGAVPATVALIGGKIRVGLEPAELEALARADGVAKCSPRDLAPVLAGGGLGATTVAGTIHVAARLGIRVMATGGIGGVHRGGETSLDVSADLFELRRSGVAVVCSGAKVILDLPRTLEVLETLGVPVVGYRHRRLPGVLRPRERPQGAAPPGPGGTCPHGRRPGCPRLARRHGDRQSAARGPGAGHGRDRAAAGRRHSWRRGRPAFAARTRHLSCWRSWHGPRTAARWR